LIEKKRLLSVYEYVLEEAINGFRKVNQHQHDGQLWKKAGHAQNEGKLQ